MEGSQFLVSKGQFILVKFGADEGTASIEAYMAETYHGVIPGGTDDILTFCHRNADWKEYTPLVALNSKIDEEHEDGPFVTVASGTKFGDISLRPKQCVWTAGIWFICKAL
jgi:hypothetical protein